jgi:hemerythrin
MEKHTTTSDVSLGITTMDTAHKALSRELVAILQAPDHEFFLRYRRICRLLEKSFKDEEELMERISYYDLRAHREQHATLLRTLHRAMPIVAGGENFFSHQVLSLLPHWFLRHLIKMDASLIKALENAGAKPVPKALSIIL